MSSDFLHTVLITAVAVCVAAMLAVATTAREREAGRTPAGYGLVQMDEAVTSR